jgi:hypothetical protein
MASKRIAKFGTYKTKLFELYTRGRYNEMIAAELMAKAALIEKLVRWSVFVTLAIALIPASVTYLNPPVLAPASAIITAVATFLSVVSLAANSSAKQFFWFDLSRKFRTLAEEVEFFSEWVQLGKVTEEELLSRWRSFTRRLEDLIEQAGKPLKEYADAHPRILRKKLATVLRQENKGQ